MDSATDAAEARAEDRAYASSAPYACSANGGMSYRRPEEICAADRSKLRAEIGGG
jgi:hypothetical protein